MKIAKVSSKIMVYSFRNSLHTVYNKIYFMRDRAYFI